MLKVLAFHFGLFCEGIGAAEGNNFLIERRFGEVFKVSIVLLNNAAGTSQSVIKLDEVLRHVLPIYEGSYRHALL